MHKRTEHIGVHISEKLLEWIQMNLITERPRILDKFHLTILSRYSIIILKNTIKGARNNEKRIQQKADLKQKNDYQSKSCGFGRC